MDFEGAKHFILNKQRDELPDYLTYHCVAHVEDVYQTAIHLCKLENMDQHSQILAATAALFHDSGYIENRVNHEAISCLFARQYLPEFGYNVFDIEIICKAILATNLSIHPKNPIEMVVCDADLDYLGRSDFELISTRLFQELMHFGLVRNMDEFDHLQIKFFETHRYFTASAQKLRNTTKMANLKKIKVRLKNNLLK